MANTSTEPVGSIVAAITRLRQDTDQHQADTGELAMLSRVLLQLAVYQALQQHLQQTLEFWSQTAARVSHVQGHELVIRCADGTAASRVRFLQHELLRAVQDFANTEATDAARILLQPVSRIRVSVRCQNQR